MSEHMQIGEVADRTGLSQRTIRYYGEVGLLAPSSRTAGGFRLYTDGDVEKLELIKKMKTLGFAIEEMRELLDLLAASDEGSANESRDRGTLDRLARFREVAEERRRKLEAGLAAAEAFVTQLDATLGRRDADVRDDLGVESATLSG